MTNLPPLRTIVTPPAPRSEPSDGCIVLLHGYGANAHDLLPLRDEIAPSWTAVAAEAPFDLGPAGMPGGRAWFHIAPDNMGGFRLDIDGAREALSQLAAALPAAVAEAGCSIENTVILGFSQGAMLGHALLLNEHMPMRGLAACSGRIVPEIFGSGEGVPAETPVFLSHGSHVELIPLTSGHAIRAFYEENTPAAITWCEEPVGHGIGPATLLALRNWCSGFRPEPDSPR